MVIGGLWRMSHPNRFSSFSLYILFIFIAFIDLPDDGIFRQSEPTSNIVLTIRSIPLLDDDHRLINKLTQELVVGFADIYFHSPHCRSRTCDLRLF